MQAIPAPGEVIAERFRVETELGRGGMGVVLRGRDETTGRSVAIKVLLPEAVSHPEAVPRFVNEARAARELTSENAVRVYEAGTLVSGLPFMVMELLEGQDLATILEQRGRFSIPDACDAVIEACDALAEAHSRGMVHRDLKPANMFAARLPDGRTHVKVLDFGVSKVAAQLRQAALTATGTALGTPHYMAPEQLKSAKGADARADVWSLGVVLYELLSGKVPFDGRSFGMLFMQILSEEPVPLTTLRPEVPPALAEIIDRCIKKNREERYADLAALVASLARFASPSGAAAARRIAEGRSGPAPLRDSRPSGAKLGGTMLMASAPVAPASGRHSSPSHVSAPIAHHVSSGHLPAAGAAAAPPRISEMRPADVAPDRRGMSPAMVGALLAMFLLLLVSGVALAYIALRAHQ